MSRFEKLSQENNKPKAEASEEIFMTKSEIEALREEAEQIERELEEDPFIDSMDPPKELYNRIVQELKDKGIYHEDEEDFNEEKEEVVEEKKKVVFYSRWKRAGKCAAIVCLILSGVFGVAMTSETNRTFVMDHVRALVGNETKARRNNASNRSESSSDETLAYLDIEDKLNIIVPELSYRPNGMKFMTYDIDETNSMAFIQYQYNDYIITFTMSNNELDTAEASSYPGKLLKTIEGKYYDLEFNLWEIRGSEDKVVNYSAQWVYKNVFYELTGKIEENILEEILQNIVY